MKEIFSDIFSTCAICDSTEWMEYLSRRKRKETKEQPGTAGPDNILGYCLVSLCFLCNIHSIHHVVTYSSQRLGSLEHEVVVLNSEITAAAAMASEATMMGFRGNIHMDI